MLVPKPLIVREPFPHGGEPLRNQVIPPLSAVPPFGYQTGVVQDAEVLRDGWATHFEVRRNGIDRTIGLEQQIEHPTASGMANRPKDIRFAIRSRHHAMNIGKQFLTRQDRGQSFRGGGRWTKRLGCRDGNPKSPGLPVGQWHALARQVQLLATPIHPRAAKVNRILAK
jgi:hypothetical protein